MPNYKSIIKEYIKHITNENDKRIIVCALNLLEGRELITNDEVDLLNETFMALKEDYTLKFKQDRKTLGFMLAIEEQVVPVIENKHELNVLYHKLQENTLGNDLFENLVLNLIDACEHIEEDEVITIMKVIQYMTNNWNFGKLETREENGKTIRCSLITPVRIKELTIH